MILDVQESSYSIKQGYLCFILNEIYHIESLVDKIYEA